MYKKSLTRKHKLSSNKKGPIKSCEYSDSILRLTEGDRTQMSVFQLSKRAVAKPLQYLTNTDDNDDFQDSFMNQFMGPRGICYSHYHDSVPYANMNRDEYPFRTCPSCLKIEKSVVDEKVLGVITKRSIPKNTVFGPYTGHIITDVTEIRKSTKFLKGGSCWEIFDEGKISCAIDGDSEKGNWMRYVQLALADEQNLQVFQWQNGIYFVTTKTVLRNQELLLWKGSLYQYGNW